MFCPKCGEKNVEGARFCANCGCTFDGVQAGSNAQTTSVKSSENVVGNIFKYILAAFVKPFKMFDKESKKLSTPKYSLIYSGIICGIMWILSVITTIFRAARTVSYGWSGTVTTWDFGKVQYFKIIGVNLLVYVGLVAVIAGVYCLGSIVVKKSITYFKMLSITATAIMPYVLASVFLAPLLGMLNHHVGAIITIAGFVYSVLIFLGLIDSQINFKTKEQKLYFHLVCAGVLFITFYVIYYNFGSMNVAKTVSLDSIYDYLGY